MVFSSFPVYLDHPNLHQLQQAEHHHQGAGGCSLENQQLPTAPQPPSAVGGGLGSIRPGSMVDRARLAKIPLPEAGKKCPRCDSTHTKFCYFNNYSLSQPRHFCKTCRRYWTSGGALRNVPVGGGCRRNKRSKSNNNSSKSGSAGAATSSEMKHTTDGGGGTHLSQMQQPPPPLMATSTFNLSSGNLNGFHQAPPQPQLMIANGSGGGGIGEIGFHYPYLGGFELLGSHTNLYPNFQSEGVEASSSLSSPSKLEENGPGLSNSTKHFLGTLGNNQYFGWTGDVGFSGLNPSSPTTHHLL